MADHDILGIGAEFGRFLRRHRTCFRHDRTAVHFERQYRGCAGKIDNGIVTVHVGVATGRYQSLLGADLYLRGRGT